MDELVGSRNGSATVDPELSAPDIKKRVFRSHDARGDSATQFAKSLDRLEEVTRQLAEVMAGPKPPVAAIASPSPAGGGVDLEKLAADVSLVQEVGRLKRRLLDNGDISYQLPVKDVASAASAIFVGDQEAFVEKSRGGIDRLEISGSSDRKIAAAMAFAKAKWGGDDVLIRVGDQHQARIIRHAVAAGLSIANTEPEIVKAVALERERQMRPPAPEIPTIERVPKKTPAL
jgi:hypothetical protein